MKIIKLTTGQKVKVDNEDYHKLNRWGWKLFTGKNISTQYAISEIGNIFMHRFIMNLNDKNGLHVDHMDKDGLNNQKDNLRICSHADNQKNRKSFGLQKYKGVYQRYNRFKAAIKINGKLKYLGTFSTSKEAALAFNEAAIATGNTFYQLNEL